MRDKTIWADADDFAQFPEEWRGTRRALVMTVDGEKLGIACIRREPVTHRNIVTVNLKPEARRYPKALHKFAKYGIETIRSIGIKSFLTIADRNVPRSEAWLERLGMTRVGECEEGAVYQCRL